ncbi:LLM class F420-dependent oxidoreductase [Acrocarpospora pleiomorpha]|nr:TIGR03617 family F420-dependent LLM class oxidoreductase [Acrocarpospora pleiomorpha]
MVQFEATLEAATNGAGESALRYLSTREIRDQASAQEANGYAATYSAEVNSDAFLPLVAAAEDTSTIELGTGIAIAFARSPMTLALRAHHLQAISGGRFVLGLGSQIKPHITRRYSMPWTKPVAQMESFIEATRAIWACWREGGVLDVRNDHYTINLMNSELTPPAISHPDPPVLLAAVGPAMTRLACRAADGLITHPFAASASYLREHTVPLVERSLEEAGRERNAFRLSGAVLVATGATDEEMANSIRAVRRRIAFYGSTPAYLSVLEHHGWGRLGEQLHSLSRTTDPARWERMAELVDDEVVETIGLICRPDEIRQRAAERYDGLLDRLQTPVLT